MATFEQFAFRTPLYSKMDLGGDLRLKGAILNNINIKVDGHCPSCNKTSTFSNSQVSVNLEMPNTVTKIKEAVGFRSLRINCARDQNHRVYFWFLLYEDSVIKVGQFPSLADIANDEAATYRQVLDKTDAAELHKAIGLAAHGVGIGSFVYLRRIFERLIYSRFDNLRDSQGWKDEDFQRLRMNEKVKFLHGFIPDFLYENHNLYSVLSIGIHELTDEQCLAAFEPVKLSIKIILEDDKKKKEEAELRAQATAAIQAFNP